MNEITNFIDSLDLGFEQTREGSGYIISLDNSDDFSSVYNKLFLNDDLEEDDQELLEDVSYFIFTNGNYLKEYRTSIWSNYHKISQVIYLKYHRS